MTVVDFGPLLGLETDTDGAQIYLCPVFMTQARRYGAPMLGGTWLSAAFRLIGRVGRGARQLDEIIPHDQLDALIDSAPPHLAEQLSEQRAHLKAPRLPLSVSNQPFQLNRPRIMGIVNVTPDSFSDGGAYHDAHAAIEHGKALIEAGADILDIGGESTRPGAELVWEGEEMDRVLPVIAGLQDCGVPISIDTRKASVMEAALSAGAHIINDVSALTFDKSSIRIAAQAETPIVLMHAQGDPKTMQDAPDYGDVVLDVFDWLRERVTFCQKAGIAKERLILDPGLGFGKRVLADNLALMRSLPLFHALGCPVLVGASRKRYIGALTKVDDADQRQIGSVAAALEAVSAGAQIVRVHDVRETREAVDYWQGVADGAVMDLGVVNTGI